MTGLNNKRVFNQLLEGYIKRDAKLALLVLDIDHFKEMKPCIEQKILERNRIEI